MSKQVLSIEQMKHLKELGVDISKASMCWVCLNSEPYLSFYNKKYPHKDKKVIPAFTLQDILDLLPVVIVNDCEKLELRIKRFVYDSGKFMYAVLYEKQDYIDCFIMQSDCILIDAAYDMLCCLIDNGYLKVK